MDKELLSIKLQVFFEEPFWVGLCVRQTGERFEVCKITFGPEPKDYEIYAFLLKNQNRLAFSPPIEGEAMETRPVNPKRMQRIVRRQVSDTGMGTKAQQALKLQQEQNKLERKRLSSQRQEEEKERKFELNREKRKAKHRGH